MFHAEFLIEDKDVVKLLRELATLRTFNIVVRPTTNAKKGKNGIEEEVPGGTVADRVALALREAYAAGTQITSRVILETARAGGNVPNSTLITALVKAKVIKRKTRGVFTVLKK
jgi:hypothetical protein